MTGGMGVELRVCEWCDEVHVVKELAGRSGYHPAGK